MNIESSASEQENSETSEFRSNVEEAVEVLQRRMNDLESEVESLRSERDTIEERLQSVEGAVDGLRYDFEDLPIESEAGEEFGERLEQVKEEIGDLHDRVSRVDGDLICDHCGQPINLDRVRAVSQEKSGALSSQGPVETITCPVCGNNHDVTDLDEDERARVTNRLRIEGVARGDVDPDHVSVRAAEEYEDDEEEAA